MERGFVDHDDALLTAQRARHGRERRDLEAGREADAEGLDRATFAVLQHFLADVLADDPEGARPHGARLDELQRHVLVIAHVPARLAAGGHLGSGLEDAIGCDPPGQADAARLLDDQERGAGEQLVDGALLVVEEQVALRQPIDDLLERVSVGAGFLAAIGERAHPSDPSTARRMKSTVSPDSPFDLAASTAFFAASSRASLRTRNTISVFVLRALARL